MFKVHLGAIVYEISGWPLRADFTFREAEILTYEPSLEVYLLHVWFCGFDLLEPSDGWRRDE